jgi:hypothetical protein
MNSPYGSLDTQDDWQRWCTSKCSSLALGLANDQPEPWRMFASLVDGFPYETQSCDWSQSDTHGPSLVLPTQPYITSNLAVLETMNVALAHGPACTSKHLTASGRLAASSQTAPDRREAAVDLEHVRIQRDFSRPRQPSNCSAVQSLGITADSAELFPPLPVRFTPPEEPNLAQQKLPRFSGDLYTARYVVGKGIDREGWCGYCCSWYRLKDSAYWVRIDRHCVLKLTSLTLLSTICNINTALAACQVVHFDSPMLSVAQVFRTTWKHVALTASNGLTLGAASARVQRTIAMPTDVKPERRVPSVSQSLDSKGSEFRSALMSEMSRWWFSGACERHCVGLGCSETSKSCTIRNS